MDFGRTEAVFNKLGGLEGIEHFLSGRTEVKALPCTFKVWRTITVGTFLEQSVLLRHLQGLEHCLLGDRGDAPGTFSIDEGIVQMFKEESLDMYTKEESIKLTIVTLEDLGYPKDESKRYEEVCRWAQQLGLKRLKHEAVFQLCMDPGDYFGHFEINFAVRPMKGSFKDRPIYIFTVWDNRKSLDGELHLKEGSHGEIVRKNAKLVFQLL